MVWIDPARPKPVWPGDYLDRILSEGSGWVVEPKYDWVRVLLVDGVPWSRHRKPLRGLELPPGLGAGLVLDGEHIALTGEIIIWDAPSVEGPLAERWDVVCSNVPEIGRVRHAHRLRGEHAFERTRRMARVEGLVIKKGGRYPAGDTFEWLKVRF